MANVSASLLRPGGFASEPILQLCASLKKFRVGQVHLIL
jgi:hypothetical protein